MSARTQCNRPAIDPDGWYTTTQVAALLGCSQWAVLVRLKAKPQRIKGQRMEATGDGHPRWRIHGGEVLRLLGAAALGGQGRAKAAEYERQQREAMKALGLV